MTNFYARPGDLIFYFNAPDFLTRMIQFGEDLADGSYPLEAYHVAIAVDPFTKIEADGKRTEKVPIDYNLHPLITRPPYDLLLLSRAFEWLYQQIGKPYGIIGIADQALRDATRDHAHLPDRLIEWADERWPYCSSLAGEFARRAGFDGIAQWPPPDPMREWLATKRYLVRHWQHE